MALATVADLLRDLEQYHLLDAAQLKAIRAGHAETVDPRTVAEDLVNRSLLTRFQATRLLEGRGQSLLLGSYVLLDLLGEGGMGHVFKARNWKLGQTVALKVIRKERIQDRNALRRFQREIRASAKLSHPNIVSAHDADEAAGTHFLAMEFIDGTDLAKLVKQHGPLPVPAACEYIRQTALGLQHAHEQGLIHRDIKPHNLLLCSPLSPVLMGEGLGVKGGAPGTSAPSPLTPLPHGGEGRWGVVKILDMGLARLDSSGDQSSSTLTHEGAAMGTVDYAAPEQFMDAHTVDRRADIYSLGCTLYFLLTGRPPFPGGSYTEKILHHQIGLLAMFSVPGPAGLHFTPGTASGGSRPTLPSNSDIITNSMGMKLKLIPAGKFLMGSTPEEIDRVINLLKLPSPATRRWKRCSPSSASIAASEPSSSQK